MNAMFEWAALLCGVVYLVTQSFIMAPVRIALVRWANEQNLVFGALLSTFIYCPMCVGVWAAFVLGGAGYWPRHALPGVLGFLLDVLESGLASMGVTSIWSKIVDNDVFTEEEPHHKVKVPNDTQAPPQA